MSTTGRTSGGQGGVPRTVRDIRNRGMGAHGTTTGYGNALLEAAARDALAGRSPGGLADLERIAGAGSFERAPAGLQSLIAQKLLNAPWQEAQGSVEGVTGPDDYIVREPTGPERPWPLKPIPVDAPVARVPDLAYPAVPFTGAPPADQLKGEPRPLRVSPAERARMSAFPSPDVPSATEMYYGPDGPDVPTEKADPFEGVSQRGKHMGLRSPLEAAMDFYSPPMDQANFDWESAMAAEMTPDAEGKWASRVPSGPNEGLILKSVDHPTFDMTIDGEMEAGMEWFKGSDGRWYTFKKGTSDWRRAAGRMGIGLEKAHPKPGWAPDPISSLSPFVKTALDAANDAANKRFYTDRDIEVYQGQPTGLREEDARKDLYGPRRSQPKGYHDVSPAYRAYLEKNMLNPALRKSTQKKPYPKTSRRRMR